MFIVRIGPGGKKLWETQIHKGPVTCGGGRLLAKDGRYVLVYNADSGEEKWYTRAVIVDPLDGSIDEILSVEIHGKGTGQPARVQMLTDGLGVGNTDGFGWFAWGGAGNNSPGAGAIETGK